MVKDEIIIDKAKLINTLINNTPIAYIIMDENNRIHFVNDSFLKIRGLERDKTVGEICYNISNAGKHCQYCAISNAMENGCKTMLQRKDILPNKMVRYIDDYAIPLYRDKKTGLTYLLEIMVNRSEEMELLNQCNKDLEDLVKSLVLILEAKDPYTARHSQNVQKYAIKIARRLNLSETEIIHISIAAILHDIGKLSIPLSVINKPQKLTDDEYKIIKSHPTKACDILDGLIDLEDICLMVRHHHERIDGRGYPDGVKDERIDLGSRILAVADTYDAMTTDRPYRKALSREEAVAELNHVKGSQLDSKIVEVFISIPEEELEKEELELSNHSLLVRELGNDSVYGVRKDLVVELDEIENNVNYDKMIDLIFENTPCGYILMTDNHIVKYANDYALSMFGYENNVLIGLKCDIFDKKDEDIVRGDCVRMKRSVPSGNCIFDLYKSQIIDGHDNYTMYVIIDRTKEAFMREKLHRGYLRLVNILHGLLENESIDTDMISPEKLTRINERVEALADKFNLIGLDI